MAKKQLTFSSFGASSVRPHLKSSQYEQVQYLYTESNIYLILEHSGDLLSDEDKLVSLQKSCHLHWYF